MAAKIIGSDVMKAARSLRNTHRRMDEPNSNAEQFPPVSTALVDTLFEAEWGHRTEKMPKRKAA